MTTQPQTARMAAASARTVGDLTTVRLQKRRAPSRRRTCAPHRPSERCNNRLAEGRGRGGDGLTQLGGKVPPNSSLRMVSNLNLAPRRRTMEGG